jgi:hypothetical protein
MAPVKCQELRFDHIVEFSDDASVLAAAKDAAGYLKLFKVDAARGEIHQRNGRSSSWERIPNADELLGFLIADARERRIPVFRIKGEFPRQ